MSNSKKRTIGILSVIVLLCACLFFVTLAGNTREKAYAATASSVDLSQTANYTIGDASELAFTSVNGVTAATSNDNDKWESLATITPTAAEDGVNYAIGFAYRQYLPVKFATPLSVDGDIGEITFNIFAHLSSAATYCGVDGSGASWGGVGILIYPLGSDGKAGEGTLIPWDVTQDADTSITIPADQIAAYLNEDGEMEGFAMASLIAGRTYGGTKTLWTSDGLPTAYMRVKSVSVEEKIYPKTDVLDLTNADNYQIASSNKLTAVAGKTQGGYAAGGDASFSTTVTQPTATANGAKFNISQGFTNNTPIIFNKHILVEEGDTLYITLNADLSNLDWSWGCATGYPNNAWGAVILIYPMNATGAAGEGVEIPYLITQRKDVVIAIESDKLQEFVEDGVVKGFLIAGSIAKYVSNGFTDGLKSGASITVSSVSTVRPDAVVVDLDFTEGKTTLFTANGDYTTVGDPVAMVNGLTKANFNAGHGAVVKSLTFDNINDFAVDSINNTDAYYSFEEMREGSNDGYALAMKIQPWGFTNYPEIRFAKAVNVEDVCSISFRIYANLNDNSVSGVYADGNPETGWFANTGVGGGIFMFGANTTYGAGEGVLITPTIKQREWTELTLSGDDLAKLADADGYISGFSLGSYIIADKATQLYQDGQTGWGASASVVNNDKYDRLASIFIDEITATNVHGAESDWIDDENATCSQTGTKHTECEICGAIVQTGTTEVNPNKHNCGELSEEIPAQVGVAGVKAHKQCADCEKYFDAEGNELDSLVIEPLLGVKQASISTSGDIGLNFVVYLGDVDSASATFTVGGVPTDPVAGVAEGEGYFKFSYGVAPKDYRRVVTINVVDTDIEFSYSVEQYALDLEDQDPTNAAMPLVNALIDYAESARAFFAEESVVATEDLTADLTAYKSQKVGEDAAVTILNASLVVEDLTTIKIYFETADISAIDVKVDGEDVEAIKVDGEENLYVVEIANIVAKDLNKAYAVTIGGYTVTYSALSYVQAILALDIDDVALNNVVKAIYNAWVAADAFFNA